MALLPPVVATLTVNSTEFDAGFVRATSTVAASTAEISAEIKRLDASFVSIGQASEDAAIVNAAAMDKMRADTIATIGSFEMAEAKAAASTEAMGVKIDEAAAKSTATTAGKVNLLQNIGTQVGLAAGVIAVASIKMAGDFEQATNRLVTSAGESQDKIGDVRNGILDMAGSVGFTAQQLAQGMYTVDSAGFHAADSITVLKAAAQGAKIEQADLGTTVDAVTTSLVDYHQGADQAANVMSKLVTAVGEGKTTLQDLAGSLHSVTPLAANLGVSFDEVTAAVATMTVHGVSADQATQNLADTLRHLSNPTQGMVAEMGQLGLSAQKVSQDLADPSVGLRGTLDEIYSTIMNHMGPAGQVLMGTFKQSASAADDLSKMISAMPNNLQTLANQVMDNSISTDSFRKDIKGLSPDLFTLGNQFLTLFDKTKGFSDALKSGSPAAQTFEAALAKIMGDSTGLNTALMLGGDNMNRFVSNTDAVKKATADAGGNVKNWADVQNTLNQKLSDLEGSASGVAVKLGDTLLPVFKNFLDDLNNTKGAGNTAQSGLDDFLKGLGNLDDWLKNNHEFDGAGLVHDILFGLHTDNTKEFDNFAANVVTGIQRAFGNYSAGATADELKAALLKGADPSDIGLKFGQKYVTSFDNGVADTIPQTTEITGKLSQALTGPLGLLTGTMYDDGSKLTSSFANGIQSTLPQVDAAAGGLTYHLAGPLGMFTGTAYDYGKDSGSNFANGIANTLPQVDGSAGALSSGASGQLDTTPNAAFTAGNNTGNSFANGVINPLPQVGKNAGQLGGAVNGPLSGLGGSAYGSGQSVAEMLAAGMAAEEAHVAAAAEGLAATVRHRLPSSPAKLGPLSGSGSPDISGATIGKMLASGISSSVPIVAGSMDNLVGGAFSRSRFAGVSAGGGIGGQGSNLTVALYLDGKPLRAAIQKATLREERVNISNGQSIRVGSR